MNQSNGMMQMSSFRNKSTTSQGVSSKTFYSKISSFDYTENKGLKSIVYSQADAIQSKDNELWNKLGVNSGTDLDNNPTKKAEYEKEMTAFVKRKFPKGVNKYTYMELEDNNFHFANKTLDKNKLFRM